MKRFTFIFLSLLFTSLSIHAQRTIELPHLPASEAEFLELRQELGNTPEGGAALFIAALELYQRNPAEGLKCLILITDKGSLNKDSGKDSYKGYALRKSDLGRIKRQLQSYPYVIRSYFEGATPDNNYQMPSAPYSFEFSTNPYSGKEEEGKIKLFIRSGGADSARPIQVIRNNRGIWKVHEYSSIIMGIRKPTLEDDDL